MAHATQPTPKPSTPAAHGSLASYSTGFILSIGLTIAAYYLVVEHALTGWGLSAALVGLAILQLLVQLIFFLHMTRESKPRWNLIVFLFMVLVIVIVAFGSLWIMHNLDYHMTSQDMDKHLLDDEGIRR
jgi:cytochrome o ubiquinol oxidase operon protein cyoD